MLKNGHVLRKVRWTTVAGLLALAVFLGNAAASAAADAPLAKQLSDHFASLAAKVSPAVVHVATVRTVRAGRSGTAMPPGGPHGPGFPGPFFRFPTPRGEFRQEGLGSGVIITPDGYILTNNHVVEGADELRIKLSDGREFDAKLVGGDPASDIAVLKIDGKDLPTADLGDSDNIQVGNLVLAIGNPFGLDRTVTFGIVSARGRANIGISEYEDFIQTDAAINPGNSGGPLVDMDGRVIGINSAIFSRTGGYMGIGFAIPIKMAKSVMDAIIKTGRVMRGWLGVNIQDVSPDLAKALGLKRTDGALVAGVLAGTPAEKAGLQRGDLIVQVDDYKVDNTTQLRNHIAGLAPGTKVTVTVVRAGEETRIQVLIGERPQKETAPQSARNLGFEVQALTEELRSRFRLPKEAGVVVVAVDRTSNAFRAGLRPGMAILEVNRQPVPNMTEFNRLINQAAPDENLLLLISHDDMTGYILIPPEKE